MFETFDDTPKDYVPNNIHPEPPKIEFEVKVQNLREVYNGTEVVGYEWDYGEDVIIPITNTFDIEVAKIDIISTIAGEVPTAETKSDIGARWYNLADVKSWKLTEVTEDNRYIWTEDESLTFYRPNTVKVKVSPVMYGKALGVEFFNTWGESVYNQFFTDANNANVEIPVEVSKEVFLRGVYTMLVSVSNETGYEQISKFTIWVD